MPKINNVLFGVLAGLICFIVGLIVVNSIHWALLYLFEVNKLLSERLLITIALAFNIFPFHYYDRRNAIQTNRGILLFVFIIAGYLVYNYFLPEL